MRVTINQPKKYTIPSDAGGFAYDLPAFDQDYSIDLSFPDNQMEKSFSGLECPSYKIAKSLQLIETHTYSWSGLLAEEIKTFVLFLKRFNNSYQPFTMTYNGVTRTFIISGEPAIEVDRIGLSTITLKLIKTG